MRKRSWSLQVAEPKAAYGHRPPLVIDASVMAAALFGEDASGEAGALLLGRALHAPHLLDQEIASVGQKKLRREGVSRDSVTAALLAYGRLAIVRHAVDAAHVVSVAERYSLTAYDAAYLCVAEQLPAPLATLDDELAAAARAYLSTDSQVHDRE